MSVSSLDEDYGRILYRELNFSSKRNYSQPNGNAVTIFYRKSLRPCPSN